MISFFIQCVLLPWLQLFAHLVQKLKMAFDRKLTVHRDQQWRGHLSYSLRYLTRYLILCFPLYCSTTPFRCLDFSVDCKWNLKQYLWFTVIGRWQIKGAVFRGPHPKVIRRRWARLFRRNTKANHHATWRTSVRLQQVDNSAYQPVEEVAIMRKESIIIVKTKERKQQEDPKNHLRMIPPSVVFQPYEILV